MDNTSTSKHFFVVTAAISLLSLQSCATLFTGTKDTIHFESQPSGAKVQIQGLDVGRTPVDVPVTRSIAARTVTMNLDGYHPRTFDLTKEFNAVSVLNLFGILGWGIDVATGAVMKYDQKAYSMELEKKKETN
ncbi:PEGA domain-containing protein [Spirosoma pulveris]